MFFQRIKTQGLCHRAYVLGCGQGLAVVVGPRRDVAEYLRVAREEDPSIAYVLETHRQEDWTSSSDRAHLPTRRRKDSHRHPRAVRVCRRQAGRRLGVRGRHDALRGARDARAYTREHELRGPSQGRRREVLGVFTGDVLFVGASGRTDLPDPDKTGESAGLLYDALHRQIVPLGDQAWILPAHGAGSACGGNISERDDTTSRIENKTNPRSDAARVAPSRARLPCPARDHVARQAGGLLDVVFGTGGAGALKDFLGDAYASFRLQWALPPGRQPAGG